MKPKEENTVVDSRFCAETKRYLDVKATNIDPDESEKPTLVGYKGAKGRFSPSWSTVPFWPPFEPLMNTTTVRIAPQTVGRSHDVKEQCVVIEDRRHHNAQQQQRPITLRNGKRPITLRRRKNKRLFSTIVASWFERGDEAGRRVEANDGGPLPTIYRLALQQEKRPRRLGKAVVLLSLLALAIVLPMQQQRNNEPIGRQLKETAHLFAAAARSAYQELRLLFTNNR